MIGSELGYAGSELGYAGSEHVANSNVANSTSSETGVNPSPLKKQKILGDCLSSTQEKSLSSRVCISEKKVLSGELDLQTANVKANGYDAVAHDHASNKPLNKRDEMLEAPHSEGEKIFFYF